jgi:hypothetical protein
LLDFDGLMVRIGDFEFSLKEFSGSLGDFGPLNPFILGYIVILGLNPAGIFLAMGLANIILGLVYRLPLPVEAKKVIGVVALEEKWNSSQVYLSGILTGIVWLLLTFSKAVRKFAKMVPLVVIRGIQLGLMFILLKESIKFMQTNILLAIISVALIILLINNRFLPSAIAIFCVGLAVIFLSNQEISLKFGLYVPELFIPHYSAITSGLLIAIVAQIILTFSNAILATQLVIRERFPRREISEENLAKNMGFMNTFFPFIGGIPMCHGAGGFASQYFFGARTGGSMIMEGVVEITLALFLAESITSVFGSFPLSIIGAMLLFASIELGKFVIKVTKKIELIQEIIIGIVSLLTNLAFGFLVGLLIYYFTKKISSRF